MSEVDTAVIDPPELVRDLRAVGELLIVGNFGEARALVAQLQARWPGCQQLEHYARAVAPPQIRVGAGHRGRSLDRERAWLAAHAREYPGCWMAVCGDQLIAADPDYSVVLERIRSTVGTDRAVVYKAP